MATGPAPQQVNDWQNVNDWQDVKAGGQTTPPESDSNTFLGGARNVVSRIGSNFRGMAQPFMQAPSKTLEGIAANQGAQMRGERPPDTISNFQETYAKDKPLAFENLAGDVGTTALVGGALHGATKLPAVAQSIGERVGGYRSPVIPPELQAAGKVAKAIGGKISPTLESDIASQTPKVKGFAQETGNPLHSQQEVGHAFRGSAESGLKHFNENILGPVSQDPVPLGKGSPYQSFVGPEKDVPMKNLGEINDRLTEINNLTRAANNAPSSGATMTALERTGLENEGNFLRNRLYDELSKRTGISPEDIKAHREGYGQQFGIADVIDQARRARMGQMGASAEGSTGFPTSKSSLVEKGLTALRGGREYIANKNLRNALNPIPIGTQEFPQPIYPRPKPEPYLPSLYSKRPQ